MDKAGGISSHGVVSLVRRALGTRSVGHAGTLDPMATGLLVLGVGQGTKLLNYLVADDKRYRATVTLGTSTDTLDAEGRVTATAEVPADLLATTVDQVARSFLGEFAQRVPDVSAVKRGGEALYKKARRGETIDAPERTVIVHALELEDFDGRDIRLSIHCGKGFYVRSLARDLGERLGTVAHLSSLRRVTSGHHGVDDAIALERVVAARSDDAAAASVRAAVLPLSRAVSFMARMTVSTQGCDDLAHGRVAPEAAIIVDCVDSDAGSPIAFMSEAGELVAVGFRDNEGLHAKRGFPPGA